MEASLAGDFAERQLWSYKTRSGEEASTILINKVESHPKLGQIFHISVIGLRMKNPRAPSGMTTEIHELPVSRQTLEASCTTIVGESSPHPEYLGGYPEWRRAVDQGGAGIWTGPVSEIVQALEDGASK